MIDGASWRLIGEGIGIGASGVGAGLVAAVFGLPAIRDGLRQLRELVERVEAALDKLAEGMAAIDRRLTAVEVTNTLMLGVHHPDSLPQATDSAQEIIEEREKAEAAGHLFRRAGDHRPSREETAAGHPLRRATDHKPDPGKPAI